MSLKRISFLLIPVCLISAAGLFITCGKSQSILSQGPIAAWGYNGSGQCDVPSPNSGFIAVAAGGDHSLGLRADGSIAA